MASMQKSESHTQYRDRLESAATHLKAARALMDVIVDDGIPVRRAMNEIVKIASELAETAANFLRSK